MIKPGQLLVSSPDQQDENFRHSVVLISEHHSRGTVGFVTNRSSKIPFRSLMSDRGYDWPYDDVLYVGGPVNSSALITLHSPEWYSTNTLQIARGFAISSDEFMMEKISMGNTPQDYRFIGGMSGWAPGQLEREIITRKWLTIPATSDIVFQATGEVAWRHAIEKAAQLATQRYF